MKNKSFLNILGAFLVALFMFAACEKEAPVSLEAQNETWGIANITSTSATLSGIVVAQGEGNKEYGVCLSTTTEPTVENMKVVAAQINGAVYKVEATGLEYLTKYYVRAYVISNSDVVSYGEEVYFTTLANIPAVTIATTTAVAGKSATSGGEVTNDGKADVTAKGIVWSTSANPTTADHVIDAGEGTGAFVSLIKGLDGATTYYVRAFATNKMGTAYSNELSFTTLAATPTVTTDEAGNQTLTTIDATGTVVANGGAAITERGFVWATTDNPTTADNSSVVAGTDLGEFSKTIEGLTDGTVYYVRAYAKNSVGTEYGASIRVKTISDIQKLWIPGGYQQAAGYSEGNWNPETAPYIMNTKDDKIIEGYIYFAQNSQFKFTPDQNWDKAYGSGILPGTLSLTGGDISIADAGVYRLRVDLVNLTYTAEKVDWSLIGGAIVPDWSVDVDMVYNKNLKKLVASYTFTADKIKFRANHGWDINYGDNGADGTVEYGGADIPVNAGAYSVMLDLNTKVDGADEYLKLPYSYSVTTWGIIGDAIGSWNDDVNMTLNAANNTWTYTGSFEAGKQFKFRANDGWAINLGGTPDKLVQDGGNIDVTSTGIYTVVLNLANGTYTMTPAPLKKKK